MLNHDRVQLLIDRLRDPESKQARGKLSDGIGKCCLGHACDVYIEETGEGGWEPVGTEEYDDHEITYMLFAEEAVLPPAVRDWFGFEEADPFLSIPGAGITRASNWNDDHQYTLPEIAKGFEALMREVTA